MVVGELVRGERVGFTVFKTNGTSVGFMDATPTVSAAVFRIGAFDTDSSGILLGTGKYGMMLLGVI